MEERFFESFIHCFFIAFGVVVGGSIIGSIGAFATGDAPLTSIARLANNLRIWAVVAAIGGTFDAIENFQRGLLGDGTTMDLVKQVLLILSAMGGVKTATTLIEWLIQEDIT
ncbi:YtrH family sporulation protein [Oceanobacillus salinisoli]|uniref:YtrH family sporulation protein n=1 Tax=Oceanobacillus salinisoli TaxID=2678611 RepID=UPI0012E317FE|nr:YtrH family sporulation protein [Oceanobacillus salinisoli]